MNAFEVEHSGTRKDTQQARCIHTLHLSADFVELICRRLKKIRELRRNTQKEEQERENLKERLTELTDDLQRVETEAFGQDRFLKAVRKFMEMDTITAPMLKELIDKIEVYAVQGKGKNKTQRIVIHYNFVGTLDLPKDEKKNYTLNSRQGVAVEYLTDDKTA